MKWVAGSSRDAGGSLYVMRALCRRRTEMIKRVSEVDALVCLFPRGEIDIIAFIVDHRVIDKILRHLVAKGDYRVRGPPRWLDLEPAS